MDWRCFGKSFNAQFEVKCILWRNFLLAFKFELLACLRPAQNNLMGEIPVTLDELKGMAQEYNMNKYPLYVNGSSWRYDERLVVNATG